MKKRAPRKLEDKNIPQLKKKLDQVLSKWVRNIYSDGVYVTCYTCGKSLEFSEAHCGHWIPRTESPTRYDPRNVRLQDAACNTFRSGMPHVFRENLVQEIGEDQVKELVELSKQPWKWDRLWLIQRIRWFQDDMG